MTNLNLRQNDISNFEHFAIKGRLEFLVELNLSFNDLTSLDHIELKNLKKLILNDNKIARAEKF